MGHQKQVNAVVFSPDGRLIATASWDNSVKIFDKLVFQSDYLGKQFLLIRLNRDGKFLATLRGHVSLSAHT